MMSDKDIDTMSYQKNFTPRNHMGILNVLTKFEEQVLTWMTSRGCTKKYNTTQNLLCQSSDARVDDSIVNQTNQIISIIF